LAFFPVLPISNSWIPQLQVEKTLKKIISCEFFEIIFKAFVHFSLKIISKEKNAAKKLLSYEN